MHYAQLMLVERVKDLYNMQAPGALCSTIADTESEGSLQYASTRLGALCSTNANSQKFEDPIISIRSHT